MDPGGGVPVMTGPLEVSVVDGALEEAVELGMLLVERVEVAEVVGGAVELAEDV